MQEHQYLLFIECVVLDTKCLAQTQASFKTSNSRIRPGHLHMMSASHYTHIGVLVFQAENIAIVYSVKSRSIKCFVQFDN